MSSLTGQTSQGIAAPESSLNGQNDGINSHDAIYQGNNEGAAAGWEMPNDSGFFEDVDSYTPRVDYQDFQLYQDDDLPEIDPDTDRFFADADALIQPRTKSFSSDSNDSGVDLGDDTPGSQISPCEEDALLFEIINEVAFNGVSDEVYKALKDYDIHSQLSNTPNPPPRDGVVGDANPLRVWVNTYLRHEQLQFQVSPQEQQ
ncbi:hypothetical protein IFR05_007150 [Cadophora sp. M221]|nr:hypothetical protein IFR05_007150 [Cadophora sp. M221]